MLIILFIEWLTGVLPGPIALISSYITAFQNALPVISSILSFVAWVFPLDVVVIIFDISLSLLVARIGIALWKLLPLT